MVKTRLTNTGPTTITTPSQLDQGAAKSALTSAATAPVSLGTAANYEVLAANAAAASPTTSTIPVELGGTTLTPGVYASSDRAPRSALP
jgi:hypothetical protein